MKIPKNCPVCHERLNVVKYKNTREFFCYKPCFNEETYHFNLEIKDNIIHHISRGLPTTNHIYLSFDDKIDKIVCVKHNRKLLFKLEFQNIDDFINFYLLDEEIILSKIKKLMVLV